MVPRAQCTRVLTLRTHTTSLRLGQPVPRAPQISGPVAVIAAKGDALETVKEVSRTDVPCMPREAADRGCVAAGALNVPPACTVTGV